MIWKELVKLATDLDKNGHGKFADSIDAIVQKYASEYMYLDDAAPEDDKADDDEGDEAPAPATEEVEEAPAASAPAAAAPMAAPAGDSPLGINWYTSGPGKTPDLAPVPAGSMLAPVHPSGAAPAAPVAAPAVAEAPAEDASGEDDEGDSEEAGPDVEAMFSAAKMLVQVANDLDAKGFSKEADAVNDVLSEIEKSL